MASISASAMYFHLPPLFLSLATPRPTMAAMPRGTPRPPTLKTSRRLRPKQANISTLQRPRPRTAISRSSTSSYGAPASSWAESSPVRNLSASPCTYSAFRCDRPADRSVSMLAAATSDGWGKRGCCASASASAWAGGGGGWKSSMKRRLMALAAAPDTCWLMMPLARLSNGSIVSASPSGLKMRQWCARISGPMRGSTLMRCAHASSSSAAVVVVVRGALDGDATGGAITRDVSGESSVALVRSALATRATLACCGLAVAVPLLTPSAMRPTALGVGVAGGGGGGGVGLFCARRFFGVDGAAAGRPSSALETAAALLLRFRDGAAAGGGIAATLAGGFKAAALASAALAAAAAHSRADLRDDMVSFPGPQREQWWRCCKWLDADYDV